MDSESTSSQNPHPLHSRVLRCDNHNRQRKIGYTLIESKEPASSVILYFYPLSGCSSILGHMAQVGAFVGLRCSILCVDRPGCGETTDMDNGSRDHVNGHLLNSMCNNIACGQSNDCVDIHVQRIQQSAEDVLNVLRYHRYQHVYILGACIGHPYAIQVCRELLAGSTKAVSDENIDKLQSELGDNTWTPPQLQGLTLVAPFVSTACPNSWWLARLGASIPGGVVSTFLQATTNMLEPLLIPLVLRPSFVQRVLSDDERLDGGWTDADLQHLCDMLLSVRKLTANSKPAEAQLGVSKSWQHSICDEFAKENGMLVDHNGDDEETREDDMISSNTSFPIRIYATESDKLANIQSIRWVADRCYGGSKNTISIEPRIHGHETMTMLGGPLRNPVLFHKIAREWGLLSLSDQNVS